MPNRHLIPGLSMLLGLGACSAAADDSQGPSSSSSELSVQSWSPAAGGPALMQAKAISGPKAVPSIPQQVPALSVSCEQPVELPRGSSTTSACTVTSALAGQIDVMVRGVPPEYSATMLAETASVAAGGSVRFPVGINTTAAAGSGLVMLRIEHSGMQDQFYDAIEVAPTRPRRSIKLVYMVASDGVIDYHAAFALDRAARHLQSWLGERLGGASTIVLGHDETADYGLSVAAVRLAHDAAWYAERAASGAGEVVTEAFAATGGGFGDGRHAWVYFIDVPGAASAAGGGVAVLGAEPLRALVSPGAAGACQAVGTLGAAIVQLSGGKPSQDWHDYPSNALSPEESAALAASDVVSTLGPLAEPLSCDKLTPP